MWKKHRTLWQKATFSRGLQNIEYSMVNALITYFCLRFPLTRYELITVVSFKNCASKNAMCQKLVCSNNYSPVCGNDAITYTNHCHLQMATCTAGIQLAHIGECVKGQIFWEGLKNLKTFPLIFVVKVQTFWEAHKNLRNLPHAYFVNVQSMRKIFSNCVCS